MVGVAHFVAVFFQNLVMQIVRYLSVLILVLNAASAVQIAREGKALVEIVIAPDALPPTERAATELAQTLQSITGATIPISRVEHPGAAVFVGKSAGAFAAFGEINDLHEDEVVQKTRDDKLFLMGGGTRGDLYAVARFLQEQCGVRWWTPWASKIPPDANLSVSQIDRRYCPPFELREPFWMPAFASVWAIRNGCNGQSAHIPPELGGSVQYKGFVHTFYPLVPPAQHFDVHPEWYSLIKGKRTHDRAQLCLTNPKLREFLVEQVKQWLRESPEARIISVSQNDWYGACECDHCQALDEREGSHAGTMLDIVNYVAAQIEEEFPNVSVDTLAYQYTRKPPKTLRPRKNVIVRLCSIECNFREPLESASNAAFADDIKGWAAITDRLYVWDYTTDFSHYVQPHPNWFVLGPNIRFFQKHNVRGIFEQGAYQSHGSEMAELRAWVLAQLLWNPAQDDRALIREFLEGYYGAEAAKPISDYLTLMTEASKRYYLTCFSPSDAGFLNPLTVARSEKLWSRAEAAVQNNSDFLIRVRLGRLPLKYLLLARWDDFRKQAADAELKWPVVDAKETFAREFLDLTKGQADKPWTIVTRLNESGLTPDKFVKPILSEMK